MPFFAAGRSVPLPHLLIQIGKRLNLSAYILTASETIPAHTIPFSFRQLYGTHRKRWCETEVTSHSLDAKLDSSLSESEYAIPFAVCSVTS